MRSGRLVKDHHRTTERHTPQPAGVSLAELRGLFEPALSELWSDLCIRRRCGDKEHEQQQSVEMASNLHRLSLYEGSKPPGLGSMTLRPLQDDLDVRLGHRLPQIPVHDVATAAFRCFF